METSGGSGLSGITSYGAAELSTGKRLLFKGFQEIIRFTNESTGACFARQSAETEGESVMTHIIEADHLEQIYQYQMRTYAPYFFATEYHTWEKSFLEDVDGEGRTLFRELFTKAVYDETELIGFVQYGKTAFGFDSRGEISSDVSYCVIRNLYFNADRADAGSLLLKEAMAAFAGADRVYAFFHYFGMSCFARHGKLFEQHAHIDAFLKENRFETEHENVYYSSVLNGDELSEVEALPCALTKGNQQYISFKLSGSQVGGCEVHFLDEKTAYLRWIYVNDPITGKGIGTKCMNTLKHWLYQKGIRRFDTDTALANSIAQHFYEKNRFTREGITRSYYRA